MAGLEGALDGLLAEAYDRRKREAGAAGHRREGAVEGARQEGEARVERLFRDLERIGEAAEGERHAEHALFAGLDQYPRPTVQLPKSSTSETSIGAAAERGKRRSLGKSGANVSSTANSLNSALSMPSLVSRST